MNPILILWNKIPSNIKAYAICIILVVIAFLYSNWRIDSLKAKLVISENNLVALKDTVRVVKTKNGELEFVKLALMSDKKGLKALSDSLAKEVDKEKGKVKYIISTNVSIKHDTVEVESHVVDSSIMWAYDHDDSAGSRHLAGISNKHVTKITRDELSLNLIAGLKERDDKKMEIFVRSKYPGVTFGNIEGAVIDPMKPLVKPPKKWFSVGPCAGIILDPTGAVRYGIGLSCQVSLYNF